MAEFKLGRIRFIWKDEWTTGTTYLKDDIIRNGGKTYVCVVGHTASLDFYTDLDSIPTHWNQVSDGSEWKGDWATNTFYKLNDLVKYGGNLYICTESHTSALNATLGREDDNNKWDQYAEGFDWKGIWTVDTRYKLNDVVKYGGQSYLCNTHHTSAETLADGLEVDLLNWDLYAESFDWKGDWAADTRYKINDIVKYGGQLYVCNLGHTSALTASLGLENDQLKWDYFNKGLEFKQDWATTTRYKINDIVKYGSELWLCTTYHTSSSSFDETKWYLFVEGLEFESSWSSVTVYQPGDVVTYGGYAYISKTNHTNQIPTSNSDDWDLFTTGFSLQGDWSGATAYKVGDVVRVNGYTYVAIADGTNHEPPDLTYWERLNSGIEWQGSWLTATAYQLGDTVKYGPNSYICILPHTSSTPSRPDNDTIGTYWNQLVAGEETSVLTTQGDLVYFGGAGPTRLPLGQDGQVLTVNTDTPEWRYFGVVDQVYYVATTGRDLPAPQYGITLDQPWKTVRYATQQIEKGPKYPLARDLLQKNRVFIQAEVVAWIDAQIAGSTPPFASFTYDSVQCRRDVGYIVDALIYDLTHGGNTKTREAASYYVDPQYSQYTAQKTQDIACYNYMLTVIDDVLTNTSIVANTTEVDQQITLDDAESTAFGIIDTLVTDIINQALTDGNMNNVPVQAVVNYTIFVKTGIYYETLPIIVPAETAIVGDELRSTNIRPTSTALIPTGDKAKSVEAYQYLQSLTSDIIQGNAVSVLSSLVSSNSTAETSVQNNIAEMKDIIKNGLTAVNAFTLPTPTGGTGNAFDADYFNAARLVNANKAFLQAEISAWINVQIAAPNAPFVGFVYGGAGQTACERDIGYIVDALRYDLTYGGNLETIVAARSYYSQGVFVETGEQAQALAVQTYLKSIIDDIANGTSIVKSSGNALTQDTSGTLPVGTAPALFAQDRIQEIYDTINTGSDPATISPGLAWVNAGVKTAGDRLVSKKSEIEGNVITFLNNVYPNLVFDEVLCSRDVGYIIDALVYDIYFGSNFRSIKAAMSYFRNLASTQVVLNSQRTAELAMLDYIQGKIVGATQVVAPDIIAGIEGDTGITTSITSSVDEIIDIFTNGLSAANAFTLPTPTGGTGNAFDADYFNAARLLNANRAFLIAEISAWINVQIAAPTAPFVGFVYGGAGQTACERDVGYIVDAIRYDLTYGGNLETIVAARSYYSLGTFVETGEQSQALAVQTYLKSIIDDIVSGNAIVKSSGNALTQDTSGTLPVGTAPALFAQARIQEMYDTINTGTAPTQITPDYSWVDLNLKTGFELLQYSKEQIKSDCVQFVKSTYPTLVFDEDVCSRDVGYLIDAVGYDMMFGSNVRSVKAGMSYHRDLSSLVVVLGDQNAAHLDMFEFMKYKLKHMSLTGAAVALSLWDEITSYMNGGVRPPITGSMRPVHNNDTTTAAMNLLANKEFLVEEAIAYINDTYPLYAGTYNETFCRRDTAEFIDAIVHDMMYPGNYKTTLAVRYYRNGLNVTGSVTEDMFYMRNGTGLRNCTVQGLTGTLGSANAYGTQRPTAGAYVSLDPSWGPNQETAWITTRSPYVQNVTTFGTACVGLKVDGSLHNGGNDSVVANDFTQVISDGIGAWVTNLGRAELVSVFSYYGHIGYLAENGGKIRATNGNSSYGKYGCVSEGVDPTETIVTANVDNRAIEAYVGYVYTSGASIYRLEYTNAGINYNSGSVTINGAGYNATAVANEFRDNGVFNVRITNDGGDGYITASNVAQGGNTTSISLAATDTALSSAYVGMRVLIISGTGVGQYGYINTYNSGSKLATVYKESTSTAGWDHVVPGTPIVSALDLTTNYIVEPRISLTAPNYTVTSRVQQNQPCMSVVYGDINATYSNILSTGGLGSLARFTIVKTGVAYSVTNTIAGTGYAIGDILTILGSSVGGVSPTNDITIEVTNITLVGGISNFEYSGVGSGGRFVAISSNGTTQYSIDGITWTLGGVLPNLAGWTSLEYGALNGVSTWVAVNGFSQTTAVSTDGGTTWIAGGTISVSDVWGSIAYGNGYFIVLGSSGNTQISSNSGTTWTTGGSITGSGWSDIVYGNGIWVAISSTAAASSTNNGTTWTLRTLPSPGAGMWKSVTWGNGRFVAIAYSSSDTAYSLDGINWYSGGDTTEPISWTNVSYGQGLFLAVSTSSTNIANTSEDGLLWTSRTLANTVSWTASAFGNPSNNPIWAVISFSTSTANSIVMGATAKARCKVVDNKVSEIRIIEPGSGYTSAPTLTITDPNNTVNMTWTVRTGVGVLANPTFTNRGTGYTTATATVTGNGSADVYQTGSYIYVKNLTENPTPGSNIQFAGDSTYYKLVTVTQFVGSGPYTARLQVSPTMTNLLSPAHDTATELRIQYSQVRLTGHDFLDIGTGNFANTNYPELPLTPAIPANEAVEYGGGRVFYTSTDQDGNFRVGTLFSVEQATGVATLNADAFNIAGLNELTLGAVALGGSGATITEFSTDPFFTADSDSVIPTQRAIKAYISSQIGGGSGSLNVNTLTAGAVYVASDYITTTTGVQINVLSKMNFTGGVNGIPVAMNLFLQG